MVQLPKGAAAKKSAGANPFARYKQRYFEGENASGAPFIHAIVGLFFIGYTIDCELRQLLGWAGGAAAPKSGHKRSRTP